MGQQVREKQGQYLSAIGNCKASGGEAAPAVASSQLYLGGSPHHTQAGTTVQGGALVITPSCTCAQPCGCPHLSRQTVASLTHSDVLCVMQLDANHGFGIMQLDANHGFGIMLTVTGCRATTCQLD